MIKRVRLPLLLFSDSLESEACLDGIRRVGNLSFRFERVGNGPTNARQRTDFLLEHQEPPCAVLGLGVGIWLLPALLPVQPLWIRESKGTSIVTLRPSLKIKPEVLIPLGWHSSRLITLKRPVTSREQAEELANEHLVEVADTEGGAILEACVERKVECALVLAPVLGTSARRQRDLREESTQAMAMLGGHVAKMLAWLNERELGRTRVNAKL